MRPRAKPLVLMVDDNPALIDLAQRILEKNDYTFSMSTNAMEGLQKFEVLRPDIMLIDYDLPDLNGLVLVESIRRLQVAMNYELRLAMFTAEDSVEIKHRAEVAGCDAFLVKPLKPDKLLVSLAELL